MNAQLNDFALLVQKMRNAQVTYFEKVAIARKKKGTSDWAAANGVLKEAKKLEGLVDARIAAINPIVTAETVLPNG